MGLIYLVSSVDLLMNMDKAIHKLLDYISNCKKSHKEVIQRLFNPKCPNIVKYFGSTLKWRWQSPKTIRTWRRFIHIMLYSHPWTFLEFYILWHFRCNTFDFDMVKSQRFAYHLWNYVMAFDCCKSKGDFVNMGVYKRVLVRVTL